MELLAQMFALFPRSDAVDIIWHTLRGYWNATDNLYVGIYYKNGLPGIERGLRDTEFGDFGTLIDGRPTGVFSAEITLCFPARLATENWCYVPEKIVTMHLDAQNLDQDGKINIMIEDLGTGDWYTYALVSRDINVEDEGEEDPSIKWITPDANINMRGMNIIHRSENLNFSADANAKLSLYVNAAKGSDGQFLFDDGQDWLLIAEMFLRHYPLFPRKFVQLGRVHYAAFYEFGGEAYDIFHVLVTVTQSAGYEIYDCIFDNDKKAFRVEPVYLAEGINPVGSSFE